MQVFRSKDNPLIEPKDIKPSRDDFEVIGVFNAAVARLQNEVILLLRVAEKPICRDPDVVLTPVYDIDKRDFVIKDFSKKNPQTDFSDPRLIITPDETYLTSISHLRVARSKNGINFEIENTPILLPENEYETFGIEDPRISLINGIYYMTYVSVSPLGITTSLASTKNFNSFERLGVIFYPDNKDVVLFNESINGKYYALHRPVSSLFAKRDIWIAESNDMICWGNHRRLMGPDKNRWDNKKIGAGAVPFKIEQGWLEIYHGVDQDNRYCLGAVLTDAKEPWKIAARTTEPIFQPKTPYDCNGFFGNVVFSCGYCI